MTKRAYAFFLTGIILTAGLTFWGMALPSFPGAEGYGSETSGGRGGKVLQVTNLQDNGAGSFDICMPNGRLFVHGRLNNGRGDFDARSWPAGAYCIRAGTRIEKRDHLVIRLYVRHPSIR